MRTFDLEAKHFLYKPFNCIYCSAHTKSYELYVAPPHAGANIWRELCSALTMCEIIAPVSCCWRLTYGTPGETGIIDDLLEVQIFACSDCMFDVIDHR